MQLARAVGDRVEHPVAAEDLALVGEVDRRHLELLGLDVLPHVELGPVGEREDADVLAPADAPVVEVPQLGALGLAGPSRRSRRGSDMMRSLARARSSSRRAPPKAASKPCSAIASSSVVVCRRLREARGPVSSTTRPASIESCTRATISRSPQLGHAAVAELDHLGEVVAGVDVHEREREARRAERLLGQPQRARSSPCRR